MGARSGRHCSRSDLQLRLAARVAAHTPVGPSTPHHCSRRIMLGGLCDRADLLLTLSNLLIIVMGSFAFFKCLSKRAKTLAKVGGSLMKKKPSKAAKVHPL